MIAPAVVQGDAAPLSIVAAIRILNRWMAEFGRLDAIILARGGGSIEELWAFNDERVARAVAESLVPIVTGVGHETDFTIVDFIADLRAATPTGAAMLVARMTASCAISSVGSRRRLRRVWPTDWPSNAPTAMRWRAASNAVRPRCDWQPTGSGWTI